MKARSGFLTGANAIPFTILLALQAVGAAVYFAGQPRGFEPGSRSFFEHQVLVPAYFAVAVAALMGVRWDPRVALLATALSCGGWVAVMAVAAAVGSGPMGLGFVLLGGCMAAVWVLLLTHSRRWGYGAAWSLAGAGAGLAAGAAFLYCAWAPPASIVPGAPAALGPRRVVPAVPTLWTGGTRVGVQGRLVSVEREGALLYFQPGFEAGAWAPSGFWTVADFQTVSLPAWEVQVEEADGPALERRSLRLRSRGPEVESDVRVTVEGGGVRFQAVHRVLRELPVHLSSVLQIWARGEAGVNGAAWPSRPSCFLAFRRGRLELLRAASDEKGPFQTLSSWEPSDPEYRIGRFRVRVENWAALASKAESPTAGWGVSQGAVERWGDAYSWSLASTSIGRGWNTVRIPAGTYVLAGSIDP